VFQNEWINLFPGEKYLWKNRKWQGIPGIERTAKGTLWATWYSGGEGEGPDNYVVLARSTDCGKTWSKPIMVIDPPDNIRAYDPCLWIDPEERMWFFWSMCESKFDTTKNRWTIFDGKAGVWCILTENPDSENPEWSQPGKIADGVMLNKPTVLSTGEWLFPISVWNMPPYLPEMARLRFSNVYVSKDSGKTIELLGQADIPDRTYCEHMIVELKDKSLWMLVRTSYGIGESFSYDKGRTWTMGRPSGIQGPGSRFFIRRLKSGNLLLINHYEFKDKIRSHMTALLSEDDGKSWKYKLLLDEREKVSYPDAVESDGIIYIIYDHDRYGAKEILMAMITEEDIKSGKIISQGSKLKILVDSDQKREA